MTSLEMTTELLRYHLCNNQARKRNPNLCSYNQPRTFRTWSMTTSFHNFAPASKSEPNKENKICSLNWSLRTPHFYWAQLHLPHGNSLQSNHIRILLLFTLNFSICLSLCQTKVMVADSLVTVSSGEIAPGFPSECSSFLSITTCPEFTGSAARVRVKNSSQLAQDLPRLSSESPASPESQALGDARSPLAELPLECQFQLAYWLRMACL